MAHSGEVTRLKVEITGDECAVTGDIYFQICMYGIKGAPAGLINEFISILMCRF